MYVDNNPGQGGLKPSVVALVNTYGVETLILES